MQKKLILDSDLLDITVSRLCQELIENHGDFENSVIIGMQPRGIFLAEHIHRKEKPGSLTAACGTHARG